MSNAAPTLKRTVTLGSAVALNVMNMVGVGPFITLPLVVSAMGGPQAILGWVLGALIAVCDGLVWAELGAAMPHAGGSYAYLRQIYKRPASPSRVVGVSADQSAERRPANPFDLGRYLSFLYIWQATFTAPLSIASGCIGLAQYAAYLWPALQAPVSHGFVVRRSSLLAAAVCAIAILLLYRGVDSITRAAGVLTFGVMATLGAIILAGFSHLHPQLLRFPPHAISWSPGFFQGLGLATLVATYDYWGYYNVCLLGGEVRDPGRTIPRAILLSIALVASMYLAMHIAVLGAIPWSELAGGGGHAAAAMLMERTWGHAAAIVISLLIIWTAFASVAALLLGYSRVPYAAARDGNYFRAFARLHPKHGFPHVSLLALGAVAMLFCFFDLARVIAALVAVRIVLQYVLQQIGVIVLRLRQPALQRPFRMWLYPLPPLVALAGFLFLLVSRKGAGMELLFAALVGLTGTGLYAVRERRGRRREPAS